MTKAGGAGQGLAAAEQIYADRSRRVKELKEQGQKVIGYFCCFSAPEVITAAGLIPYRIGGNVSEPITKADAYVETIMCPFCRSCFDIALQGGYDFLDGIVIPHTCDCVARLYDIWSYWVKHPYSFSITVPHIMDSTAVEFFTAELGTFKRSLEQLAGRPVSDSALSDAIERHNQTRALVHELYEFRKQDPPLLSGAEVTKALVSVLSLPVDEANKLLRGVITEVKARKDGGPGPRPARLLVFGPEMDDVTFIALVEEAGANVVMDDVCVGTRPFWHSVKTDGSPLAEIARNYLEETTCPRTYRTKAGTHKEDLENRFGYLKQYAQEFNVNGVILYIIRFCDTFELDAPDIVEYLESVGLPVLHIEDDYNMMSIGRLKTRVQAFVEMIS